MRDIDIHEELSYCIVEREKFETWARFHGFHTSKAIHRNYEESKLNWMWKAWQEAVKQNTKENKA